MQSLLLDTHAAIWLFEDKPLAQTAVEAMNAVYRADESLLVSPITAWEVGLLVSHRRIDLMATPERWFQRLLATPHVQLAELSTGVLIASSFLPGKPPRDPADRILAATARDLGAALVTRDRALLSYADEGHLSVLPC